MSSRVLTVVGARPQFIKAAVVSRAFERSADVEEVLVHTGQHSDDAMSGVFFEQLDLRRPHHHLGINGGGHGEMTGRMLIALEPIMESVRPGAVVVYGDTNSTLAGALAAAKLHIPVVHVEAGMRSFHRAMPEEMNRVVTDHISTLLCCPTASAVRQLAAEGIRVSLCGVDRPKSPEAAARRLDEVAGAGPWTVNTGDVMLDALKRYAPIAAERSNVLRDLGVKARGYAVLTVHRAENTAGIDALEALLAPVLAFARDTPVVFPMHPRTRRLLKEASRYEGVARAPGMLPTSPMPYLDFLQLQANAALVITDSGGVQKEAFFLGVPCLTIREETEWGETVATGWNRLVGRHPVDLQAHWSALDRTPRSRADPFGDGHAGETIVALCDGLAERRAP